MRAIVIPTRGNPSWFSVIVEHSDGVFNWRWELEPSTPYRFDADVRAARFNEALDNHTDEVVDIYRPALSMCGNVYGGDTSPVRRSNGRSSSAD